ncbi:heterogeneous nuclear ribonucleoprotein L isoform X1 [Vespula maculifrons]|uniref:Heterogeneous nuclear ribonucleoprotein L isoform X1 n=1 Tax=Vespula maculifrons TaxID=7453 RepID=A0ABD2D117_VESMC
MSCLRDFKGRKSEKNFGVISVARIYERFCKKESLLYISDIKFTVEFWSYIFPVTLFLTYENSIEVLHAISAPSGQVQRIVIFKKNGVQAMIFQISFVITFDSVESATRAKETLHGADIYSGCCTLKIDFAKLAAAIATSVVFPVGAYAKRAELLEVPRLDVMLGKTHFGMALFIGSVNVRGGTN